MSLLIILSIVVDSKILTLSLLQHFALLVWPCSPHTSQTSFERYSTSTGSLSDANLTNISTILSSKLVFLARFSLYLRINLLQASEPSSERNFKPYPEFISLKSSSECANTLCNVGVMLAQLKESKINRYVLVQRIPSWLVRIFLSEFKILRIADSCACTRESDPLNSAPTTDNTQSLNQTHQKKPS